MGRTRTLQVPERPSLPRVPHPDDSTDRTKTEGPSLTVREMRAGRTLLSNVMRMFTQSKMSWMQFFSVQQRQIFEFWDQCCIAVAAVGCQNIIVE
jgi:hypothetical protein